MIQGAQETLKRVQSVQLEVDDDHPQDFVNIFLAMDQADLRIDRWTRHGRTSVSNVLFRR